MNKVPPFRQGAGSYPLPGIWLFYGAGDPASGLHSKVPGQSNRAMFGYTIVESSQTATGWRSGMPEQLDLFPELLFPEPVTPFQGLDPSKFSGRR